MQSIVARLLSLTGFTVSVSARDVQVIESEENEDGDKLRVVRFSALVADDEVLVVRCERRENDRVVLETEEIYGVAAATRGTVVRLRRIGPDCWQVFDGAAEQYVQGVSIAKWEKASPVLRLAFTPDPMREQRRYSMTWRAAVEKWSQMKSRHPSLPAADAPAEKWPVRLIAYAALTNADTQRRARSRKR